LLDEQEKFMTRDVTRKWRFAASGFFLMAACSPPSGGGRGLGFVVSFSESQSQEALDGRILLMISTDGSSEPRFQIKNGPDTQLIFGIDVEGLRPGRVAVVGENVPGYPLKSLGEIPPGEYWVQALLHRYETFRRADGRVLKLPMDRGEGQQWNKAPGNLYSTPRKVRLDPSKPERVAIALDQVIPPISPPQDTKYIKHVKIESERLTRFWGRPMHLGAIVLLPEGFEEHPQARYPLMIQHGHFQRTMDSFRERPPGSKSENPSDPDATEKPAGEKLAPKVASIREALEGKPYVEQLPEYRTDPGYQKTAEEYAYKLFQAWTSAGFPRMIHVIIQHANPYYDDSYAVNSANCGPYGDAITYELIPYVEKTFRGIGAGWARVLYGGSTGGWESLAAQVFYPEQYNGTWSACPSPVDFRAFQQVNIYEAKNAYYLDSKWKRTPRPGLQNFLGDVSCTLEEIYQLEAVLGSKGRSGGLRDGYHAVWSPVGEDGYPEPLWDRVSGRINPQVAAYMRDNYDLRHILERDWKTLGPKLKGKLHVYCGDMDNYFLVNAVYMLHEFLESTTDPYYGGSVEYGDRFEHCWSGDYQNPNSISRLTYIQRFAPLMAEHLLKTAPAGADTSSWRY
jgi:hypothetical protein